MKNKLALLFALALALCLAACGGTQEAPAGQAAPQAQPAQTEVLPAAEPKSEPEAPTAPELFAQLYEASDGEFDARWDECLKAVEENGLTDDWAALCSTVSACVDYAADETLQRMEELYRIGGSVTSPFYDAVAPLVEAGLSEKLLAAVYTEGNTLELPPCVWVMGREELPEAVRTAVPVPAAPDQVDWWDEGWREAAAAQFGVDPMPLFEMCTAGMDADSLAPGTEARYDANLGITMFFIDEAQIAEQDLLAAYEAYRENAAAANASGGEAAAAEHRQGEPIRVLLVDLSEEIGVDGRGIEALDESNAWHVTSRAGDIWTGLLESWKNAPGFAGSEETFALTAYPGHADVWLLLDVTYPFAGRYTGGGTVAAVHGCCVSVTAVQAARPEHAVSCTFANMPGNTVTGRSTLVWKELPNLAEKPEGAALMNAIAGWFDDAG